MSILRDSINGFGESIQTMVLLIEAGSELLCNRGDTRTDFAQVTCHCFALLLPLTHLFAQSG